MPLDERGNHLLIFTGEGSVARLMIEEGDEATLYHDGNLVMATITAINANQIVGRITRSAYDPDLHEEYVSGNEIHFAEQNIFGISRQRRQA